jgi:hypothetical protein
MDALTGILRGATELVVTPFDYLGAFWGLTIFSLLSGVGMLWIVGKTTPQKAVEHARNKMDSAVYEIRLFLDSPKRVLISLGRLIVNSILYVAYMMPAFLILAPPLLLVFLHLEPRHGLEPVPLNTPFVVSVDLADGVDPRSLTVGPDHDGLEITAPPMVVASKNAVYLRAVATKKGTLDLPIEVDGTTVRKEVVTDPAATEVAPDRSSGWDLWLSIGDEARLSGPVTKISVPQEASDPSYFGIHMAWWVYWLILAMISAFGLRKRLGVNL